MRSLASLFVCAIAMMIVIGPGRAHAEPKEIDLSFAPVYALSYVDGRKPSGGGAMLDFGVGITEGFTLIATGMVSFHPVHKYAAPDGSFMSSAGTIGAFTAGVGVRYTIDVIRLVPSFEATIGVLGWRGTPRFSSDKSVLGSSTDAALGLGFQLHYLIKRYVSVGLVVRYQATLTAIEKIPVFLYLGPDVTFRFNN